MKKNKNIFLILVLGSFLLCFLNSCHKYPEDPFISLKKPINRLNAGTGTWKFTSYQIYGIEHTHDFDSILVPNTLMDCIIMFSNNKSDYSFNIYNRNKFIVDGNYYIGNNNKVLQLTSNKTNNNFFVQVFRSSTTNWTIVELYAKNLHISNNGVDIYFKKQ